MRVKVFLTISAIILIYSQSYGQDNAEQQTKPKKPLKDRIFISPDLGLQFGTVTIVNISPKVGYRITDKFAAGLGGTYIYLNDKRFKALGYIAELNIYGGSIFSQYQIIESVRAYAEYEVLSLETFNTFTRKTKQELVPSLLAGGGYSQTMGGNSSVVILVLYNFMEGPNSIYTNPVIRIGFNIGF